MVWDPSWSLLVWMEPKRSWASFLPTSGCIKTTTWIHCRFLNIFLFFPHLCTLLVTADYNMSSLCSTVFWIFWITQCVCLPVCQNCEEWSDTLPWAEIKYWGTFPWCSSPPHPPRIPQPTSDSQVTKCHSCLQMYISYNSCHVGFLSCAFEPFLSGFLLPLYRRWTWFPPLLVFVLFGHLLTVYSDATFQHFKRQVIHLTNLVWAFEFPQNQTKEVFSFLADQLMDTVSCNNEHVMILPLT